MPQVGGDRAGGIASKPRVRRTVGLPSRVGEFPQKSRPDRPRSVQVIYKDLDKQPFCARATFGPILAPQLCGSLRKARGQPLTWTKGRFRRAVGPESIIPKRRAPDSSRSGPTGGAGYSRGRARRNHASNHRTRKSPATVWVETPPEVVEAWTDLRFARVLRHGSPGRRSETTQQRGVVRRLSPLHL